MGVYKSSVRESYRSRMMSGDCTYPSESKHDQENVEKSNARSTYDRLARLIRRAGGDDDHADGHAGTRRHEQLASPKAVDEPQTTQRGGHHDGRLDGIQQKLRLAVGDSGRFGWFRQERTPSKASSRGGWMLTH